VWGARTLQERIDAVGADAVLAGAGVANLAAWVGVAAARAAGSPVVLTAELGMWGYTPTPADPYIFNHRSFPGASMLSEASHVLGLWIGGQGTKTIGCLGAAQVDRHGNLNSTSLLPVGGPFLVGSGGANDVASRADECLVITKSGPARMPEQVAYITSPGERVQTVVTERCILRKRDGDLCLAAVGPGESSLEERVREAVAGCGWDVTVDREVEELEPPTMPEILALRQYDPRGWFLRG